MPDARDHDPHDHAAHDHAGHAHVHAAPDTLGGKLLAGVAINFLIFVAQVVGGLLSNSLGLLSDAAHNLSDVVSLLLSYGANRLGKQPPSPVHTFGFRRMEVMVAFFNAAALIAIAAFVAYEGVVRLLHPVSVGGATVMLIAGIGMVANTAAAWLLKGHDDLNARSAFLHLVADAVTSLGVVIGGFLVWAFHFNAADALVSIALSAWMVKEAWGIVKSSVHILVEGSPEGLDFWKIAQAMEAEDGVLGVHALHVWAISSKEFALSAHLEVDDGRLSDMTVIVRRVKEMLMARFGIGHPTLEVECAVGGCAGGVCALAVQDGAGVEAKRKLEQTRVAGDGEE
jgi:cobalt-zinc-cadmium efflux system protein